ncbi:unnamed protein product [Lactuca virosa]|uniref:Bifunctional inhibitor/plant lipid transfer protein/seed storage helical domain-containing protein n=1 Tax=Lactuca virosa TaxID=75947 RepID=A0AAU9P584_9ASTR|nr:unnamed protein product [Lactuca virosa]
MAASVKLVYFVVLVMSAWSEVDGASECGNVSPDMEALTLIPCSSAVQDENASVSGSCCSQALNLVKNPACLCAVMLSNTVKSSGINPEIALTIPKRCNIADQPVGYQCGVYTLP